MRADLHSHTNYSDGDYSPKELIELAKKLVDESQMKRPRDDFGFDVEISFDSNVKKEKPVQHAIMVKASESDDDGLVG